MELVVSVELGLAVVMVVVETEVVSPVFFLDRVIVVTLK